MRFLNTTTRRFEQVPDSELHLDKNQYAILSHRWFADEDEVSYEDLIQSSSKDITVKKGYAKLEGFCKLAASANCRYGWVDTCCINKANSSELSEAINSMYLWYSCSKICIAYLGDVPERKFEDSEWFDRGWTLQELIAPKEVSFFDQQWNPLGTKAELLAELSRKTRIPETILNHTSKLSTCSVAQRFSWAATRITKRIEDRAYSLMGLFNINMPMIYGERENAFIRLQQHIIQKSKDESIFAWAMEHSESTSNHFSGLYAPSPSVYINCGDVVQSPGSRGFSETNGELSIWVQILPNSPGTHQALLHCARGVASGPRIFIVLARTSHRGEYLRVRDPAQASQGTVQIKEGFSPRIKQIRIPVDPSEPPSSIFYGFWLRTLQPLGYERCHIAILSNCETSEPDCICQRRYDQGNTGIVYIKPKPSVSSSKPTRIRRIKFGFDESYNPVLRLAGDDQSTRLQEKVSKALTSEQPKVHSEEHKEVFKEDLLRSAEVAFARSFKMHQLHKREREGEAVTLRVHGHEGLEELEIAELGMKISVKLHSPNVARQPTDDMGFRPERMLVWTIDITELPLPPSSISVFLRRCFFLACCPCFMLFVLCENTDPAGTVEDEQGVRLAETLEEKDASPSNDTSESDERRPVELEGQRRDGEISDSTKSSKSKGPSTLKDMSPKWELNEEKGGG